MKNCQYKHKYHMYIDPTTGHVRTTNTNIVGGFNLLLKLGLNHRPKYSMSRAEVHTAAQLWAEKVLKKFRSSIVRAHSEDVYRIFKQQVTKVYRMPQYPTEKEWHCRARVHLQHLVVFSTDKVANTPSIECIHHYRHVCLTRLLSPAFTPIPANKRDQYEQQLLEAMGAWAPWAVGAYRYRPSLTFVTQSNLEC